MFNAEGGVGEVKVKSYAALFGEAEVFSKVVFYEVRDSIHKLIVA